MPNRDNLSLNCYNPREYVSLLCASRTTGDHFHARIPSRLLLAVVLGGIIGIEREVRHKPAGLRTQMFICFGSAFFTEGEQTSR